MRDQQINTFQAGMQQDLGPTIPQDGSYNDAHNIRIVSSNGNKGTAIVTNIKGAKKQIDLKHTIVQYVDTPQQNGTIKPIKTEIGEVPCQIKGYAVIRNTLIVFSYCPATQIGEILTNVTSVIHTIDLDTYISTLIYENPGLLFENAEAISAVGRYESEDIQRVYWTDSNSPVRSINIKDNNLDALQPEELVLNPPVNFGAPRITEVNSTGSLPAGMYQYCYRLITEDGKSTRFSPLSNFTHIVSGSSYWEYEPDPEAQIEYSNTVPGEETDKAVTINVDDIELDYDTIEIVALHRTDPNSIASVYVVGTAKVTAQGVSITHTNDGGQPILAEEITAITSTPSKVKVLAAKDNRLFMAGVTYNTFNLEFNARAYRFKRPDTELYPRKALSSAQGEVATTYVDFDFDPITGQGSDKHTTEVNLDAINPYNVNGAEVDPGNSYKFHRNGITLGGEGPNVNYKFIKKRLNGNTLQSMPESAPFVKSVFKTTTNFDTPISQTGEGDYKSAINATELVGYRRGEIYRFGVVLYDLEGNPGFVNWVGDIKFPDSHDYDHESSGFIYNYTVSQQSGSGSGVNYNYYSDTVDAYEHINKNFEDEDFQGSDSQYDRDSTDFPSNPSSHLYALGIEFIVNIPEEIQDKISGYRVVRVERKKGDRTILGSGVLNYLHKFEDPDEDGKTFAAFGSHTATTLFGLSNSKDYPTGYTSGDGKLRERGVIIPNVFSIDAPDWPFEGYPTFNDSTYVKVDGAVRGVRKFAFVENFDGSATIFSQQSLARTREVLNNSYTVSYLAKLDQGETGKLISEINDELGVFNRTSFIHDNDYRVWGGVGEETLICKIENPLDFEPSAGDEQYLDSGINWSEFLSGHDGRGGTGKLLVTLKRDLGDSQYGGNTNLQRSFNSYIPAGPFISMDNSPYIDQEYNRHEVWGGDTYVVMYDIEKMRKFNENLSSDDGMPARNSDKFNKESVNFAFPVESSVNTALRSGWHFANKEDWEDDTETPLNTFDLDNVYSSQNTTETYIPKPNNFKDISEYDTRIVYSDAKINNATKDNWAKFRAENYSDLDGNRGSIEHLINFKDNLYFLQQSGFGGLSINPTSTVIDQSGTSIVLGTGDVIQDFQYISNKAGVNSYRGVAVSENGIYWIDTSGKKVYAFRANGLESLSDINGMSSWTFNNIDKNHTVVAGYDVINSEILFSVSSNETLAFSELANKFTSFYTHGTDLYIETPNKLFSTGSNSEHIYVHNEGSYLPGNIKFTVNKSPLDVKVFDTLEWYSGIGGEDKIKVVTINNSVQNAEVELLDENDNRHFPYKTKKENVTKLPFPRENGTKSRLRDNYLEIDLSFENGNKVSLHYVKTLFRISRR